MRRLLKYLIFGYLTFYSLMSSGAPVLCKYLFHTDDRLSKAVRIFQQGKTDTTSLRQEVKFVVKTVEIENSLQILEKYFQSRFNNRDKPIEGYANITSTHYMTVGKYIQNGKNLSAKVRFRKYYVRNLDDTNWKNLVVSKGLEDRSWLELKIQHPEFDNVVFKPRLLILDKDVDKLITEKYFDYKEGIIRRLKELNPLKHSDVDKFVAYFDALYTTPSMKAENMFAQTQYERTSYSIKLAARDQPDEKIDIQITLDQHIRLTRLEDGRKYNVYDPDETVVEVKIPVLYAKLTDADQQALPELSEIKKFIEMLSQKHLAKYPANKGKMSKIDKKNNMENDDDYD